MSRPESMSIALVTANLGGIDRGFPLPPSRKVGPIYVTDDIRTAPAGWAAVEDSCTWGQHTRFAAKLYKCQVHTVASARWLAWADACVEFLDLDFLPEWADLAGDDRAVFVPHPNRATVAEEYKHVLSQLAAGDRYLLARYDVESIERERDYFAQRHDLSKLPLLFGGVWLLPNVPRIHGFLNAWWECVKTFSLLDQAAISPLLVEHGIEVVPCSLPAYENEHWIRRPHL